MPLSMINYFVSSENPAIIRKASKALAFMSEESMYTCIKGIQCKRIMIFHFSTFRSRCDEDHQRRRAGGCCKAGAEGEHRRRHARQSCAHHFQSLSARYVCPSLIFARFSGGLLLISNAHRMCFSYLHSHVRLITDRRRD